MISPFQSEGCSLLGPAEEAGHGTIEPSDLSVASQMQTPNRGLTIKQYQPTIQPISVTPATSIQPIATVVTGSNVKDDYERALPHTFQRKTSIPVFPFASLALHRRL